MCLITKPIIYEEIEGVAWVTFNRPEVHNTFNFQMQRELKDVWRSLRSQRRRHDASSSPEPERRRFASASTATRPWVDGRARTTSVRRARPGSATLLPARGTSTIPGDNIGPKTNDLWKPVIAAVNGMACGGAFYMLGEVEFIIAAEHATFFDPHVSYGMTACFESIHMLQKMPFGEIMRLALLGASERMTAERAHRSDSSPRLFPMRTSTTPRRGRPPRSPSPLRWRSRGRSERYGWPGAVAAPGARRRDGC